MTGYAASRIAAGLIPRARLLGVHRPVSMAAPLHRRQMAQAPADWVAEIEKIFIRSEDCKQCHDRHYEEWKGVREQTPDLKTFGRVDAALLHGTSLESPVFRTVLGVWLQTNPTTDERRRCLVLSCAVDHRIPAACRENCGPGVVRQAASGRHRVRLLPSDQAGRADTDTPPPSFKIEAGQRCSMGPMRTRRKISSILRRNLNCLPWRELLRLLSLRQGQEMSRRKICRVRSCRGRSVRTATWSPRPAVPLRSAGAMTRAIGRHWFRGVVVPGTLLKNRNLQAEWMPRVDLEATKSASAVEGTVLVENRQPPSQLS